MTTTMLTFVLTFRAAGVGSNSGRRIDLTQVIGGSGLMSIATGRTRTDNLRFTGAMFGPGIYWADDWKKSAGYTSLHGSYWSGGGGSVRGYDAFMFVADVALGNAFVAPGPRGYTSPPAGHHCVFGKAGDSGVMNNEWIVYKTDQNQLRYLVEFTT